MCVFSGWMLGRKIKKSIVCILVSVYTINHVNDKLCIVYMLYWEYRQHLVLVVLFHTSPHPFCDSRSNEQADDLSNER